VIGGGGIRICVIGHSLIAERQALFCEALRKQGAEVLEIYPSNWNNLHRDGGFEIMGTNFQTYAFKDDAFNKIKIFSPDVIYSMTEVWQEQSVLSMLWAKVINVPLVLFVWENIRMLNAFEIALIEQCALVVCGNSDAENIVKPYAKRILRLTQVGIDTDLFKKDKIEWEIMDDTPEAKEQIKNMQDDESCFFGEGGRNFEVGYAGRPTPEKGIKVAEAMKEKFNTKIAEGVGYQGMPEWLNDIECLIIPSQDTKEWREQWPALIAEALACETPVVAYDAGNIKEHYGECEAVKFVMQGGVTAMEFEIKKVLDDRQRLGKIGREFVMNKFSNEVVAKKLLNAFEEIKNE
jgi:glycosyltransferase involved in cell wall biosynthesis